MDHIAGAAYADETGRPHHTRIADAFVELCQAYNAGTVTGGRERPKVMMSVPFETVVERGAARGVIIGVDATISGETVRKMCCDAELNRVVTRGKSTILDYGTTTRLASDAQYYAMVARDGGCRWPGCERPPGWSEVHHIDEVFLDDGPTDLNKLCLNCSTHHDYVHHKGWKYIGDADDLWLTNTRRNPHPRTTAADQHSTIHDNSNWSTHERDRNSGDQRCEGPDRGDEADQTHQDAATDRGFGEIAFLRRRWFHQRHQVAGEQRPAEREHEPSQQIVAEEHAGKCAADCWELHGLPPPTTADPRCFRRRLPPANPRSSRRQPSCRWRADAGWWLGLVAASVLVGGRIGICLLTLASTSVPRYVVRSA